VDISEMHGSRSKIPSKKSRPYIYDVKFLALLGDPYIYIYIYIYIYTNDISRLRVKPRVPYGAKGFATWGWSNFGGGPP
jgi:hypothetical protein